MQGDSLTRSAAIRARLRQLDPGDWRMIHPAHIGCRDPQHARDSVHQAMAYSHGRGNWLTRVEAGFVRVIRRRA